MATVLKMLARLYSAALAGGIALALVIGCEKKDTRQQRVPVSGTVLRLGQPVAEATVILEPSGDTPAASGQTDSAGRFQLTTFEANDGAVPGEYRVVIRKVQVIPSNRPRQTSDDAEGPPPDEKWLLNVKYGHASSSGMTVTVKAAEKNDFKLEMSE